MSSFISFAQALSEMKVKMPKPQFRSSRAELFNELYGYYERSYKKNTWRNYVAWLKKNKYKHSKEKVLLYPKDPSYRKKITVDSFCAYWFSFMDTDDIPYLNSICRDIENRKGNVNSWLFWAIKAQ